MKRMIIRFKWFLKGEPACITRKRIRNDLEQMGYEGAWTNVLISARKS